MLLNKVLCCSNVAVLLSSPSIVNVMADIDVLTLTISKSVMSDQMKLKYRVQYWERRKPEQVIHPHTNTHKRILIQRFIDIHIMASPRHSTGDYILPIRKTNKYCSIYKLLSYPVMILKGRQNNSFYK